MMRRVASMPSSSGMRMSMSTTSGSRSSAIVTAWAPSEASPTTSRSSSASRIILNPARTSAWSSAIRMRTVISGVSSGKAERGYPRSGMLRPPIESDPGADLEAAAGAPARVQVAAEDAHALAHADEAVASAAQAPGRSASGSAIADAQPAPEVRAERVGDDEGREVGPDERRIRLVAELLHGGERREDQAGGNERRATPGSHAKRHDEGQAAHGEDRARRRVEKGQLDLRLQQESSRQQQVGTAGRQGLHARP